MVEIEIVGAQEQIEALSVDESVLAQSALKIQVGNGYDHFVLDHHDQREGRDVPVFVFTERTKIAE